MRETSQIMLQTTERVSCNLCKVDFAKRLSLERHNRLMHKAIEKVKSEEPNITKESPMDYSGLDLSLMRKINALLGIQMPEELTEETKIKLESVDSELVSEKLTKVEKIKVDENGSKPKKNLK